jgi:hypothetical protein
VWIVFTIVNRSFRFEYPPSFMVLVGSAGLTEEKSDIIDRVSLPPLIFSIGLQTQLFSSCVRSHPRKHQKNLTPSPLKIFTQTKNPPSKTNICHSNPTLNATRLKRNGRPELYSLQQIPTLVLLLSCLVLLRLCLSQCLFLIHRVSVWV